MEKKCESLRHTLWFVNDGLAKDRQEQTVAVIFFKKEQISGISTSKMSLLSINNAQCPRTKINKRFLPRAKTTTA